MLVKLAAPVSPAPAWDPRGKVGLFPSLGTLLSPTFTSIWSGWIRYKVVSYPNFQGKTRSVWVGGAYSPGRIRPLETNWPAPEWKQFQGNYSMYYSPTTRNPSGEIILLSFAKETSDPKCILQEAASLIRKLKWFLGQIFTSPGFSVCSSPLSTPPHGEWRMNRTVKGR